jgi:predicted nuclease of predicted toxin-antitoxin system
MRFFADHCVPESIAAALEASGHEVLRLCNQMATDASDTDVIEKAQTLDAVLLSLNGDFSDIVRYPPSMYGGIVSIQVKNRPEVLDQITRRLTTYLSNQSEREHYRGKLLLAEAHRIRIRGAT